MDSVAQTVACDSGTTLWALWAKRCHFNGTSIARLFTANGGRDFTMRGCHLRMWRCDYANASLYKKAEWRHTLQFYNEVSHAIIKNTIVEESGGDGSRIILSSGVHAGDIFTRVEIKTFARRSASGGSYRYSRYRYSRTIHFTPPQRTKHVVILV